MWIRFPETGVEGGKKGGEGGGGGKWFQKLNRWERM